MNNAFSRVVRRMYCENARATKKALWWVEDFQYALEPVDSEDDGAMCLSG